MNEIDTTTLEGKIAVMQAAAAGSNIERAHRHGRNVGPWTYTTAPRWNWILNDYRIQKLGDDEVIVLSFNEDGKEPRKTVAIFSYEAANKHADFLRKEGYTVTYLKYRQVKE